MIDDLPFPFGDYQLWNERNLENRYIIYLQFDTKTLKIGSEVTENLIVYKYSEEI